jgi:hypothetical protein
MRGDPDREAQDLAERLEKLERRRSGYIDLAADGDLSRDELRTKLADLDEQRQALQRALRESHSRQDALRQPRINMAHLNSLLLQMNRIDLALASPGDRRRLYTALQLRVEIGADGTIRLSGIFDPDVYLLDLIQNPPADASKPVPKVPEGTRVVVTAPYAPSTWSAWRPEGSSTPII